MSVVDLYRAAHARHSASDEPGWLAQRRHAALDAFAAQGFPTRRDEAWRFSNLAALGERAFPPSDDPATVATLRPLVEAHRLSEAANLVLVNGRYVADLSDLLPAGAALLSAAPDRAAFADDDRSGPAALNAAFARDGVVLRLADGARLVRPLHVIHITAPAASASVHVRHLVELGAGASAQLLETHLAPGKMQHWSNAVTLIRLGEHAALDHVKLIIAADALIHLADDTVTIGGHARYDGFFLTLSGRLTRQDVVARLTGPKASCSIGGVALLRGDEEATLATTVLHESTGGTTREVFKAVLDDTAHAVFQGCIRVAPDAQKTDAKQMSQTLLLSERAHVDAKPELEILADDVKCAHGATVGALDEDQLFYLVSRGIPAEEARSMLVAAFASSALDTVADPLLRAYLARHADAHVGGAA